MEGKSACLYKLLVIGVIVLFIGVGIQPAIATIEPEERIDIQQNEGGNNQVEVPLFGFCVLLVWTYTTIGGYIPDGLTKLKCEDLDTGKIRNRTSGIFGYKLFIGLNRGHTYRITATEHTEASEVIELLDFWNYLEIETIRHD